MKEKLYKVVEEAEDIRRKAIKLYDDLRDVLAVLIKDLDAEKREELTFKTLPAVDSMIINAASIVRAAKYVLEDLRKLLTSS